VEAIGRGIIFEKEKDGDGNRLSHLRLYFFMS
jgi:hypothetical protein